MPDLAAIEEFARKTEVPSWARTAEWQDVPVQIRRRSFWSAALADARALSAERNAVTDLLQRASKDGKLYRRDTAINEIKALMQARGLDTGDPDALTNPAADRRIKLVLDTNRAQAQGYARFKRSSTGGALLAFPAQEYIRVSQRYDPRDWPARWTAAGGTLYGGRMIALKTDPIWTDPRLNRFGNPYPPFDFNSGMGIENVARREAIAMGIIEPDYQPDSDPVEDFNAHTQADVSNVAPELLDSLAALFGKTVNIVGTIAKFARIF